jgi:hypothetical protein
MFAAVELDRLDRRYRRERDAIGTIEGLYRFLKSDASLECWDV